MRVLLALGAALLASTSANATINLVTNGSFEMGQAISNKTLLAGGSTAITGWVVTSNGIYYNNENATDGWLASDGDRSVSLATNSVPGASIGGIYQDVSGFVIGKQYRVRFDLSANPYNPTDPEPLSKVRSSITSTPSSIAFEFGDTNLVTTPLTLPYQTVEYIFTAYQTSQRLNFRGAVRPSSEYGPVIDNVQVSAIPEPASWALLLAGFGMVGFASRRRNRAAVAA